MKRALVFSLICVFGLGIGVAAQSFTGSWSTDITFTIPTVVVTGMLSALSVDYTVGGWTFGTNMYVDETKLIDLNFDIGGQLGAFGFYSFLQFDPTGPEFTSWENVVTLSLAGMDLYGVFALQEMATDLTGAGYAIGGHGVAGDVEIWAEVAFNLGSMLSTYRTYGAAGGLADWGAGYDYTCAWSSGGSLTVQTDTCVATFSTAKIIIEVPLTCLDFLVWVNFDCVDGFSSISFDLNDIDLGAGWFQLDDLDITFTATDKSISELDFTVTLGDAICVTPYFDLDHDVAVIEGIDLDALLLSYTYNGVTIKAGEYFYTTRNYYKGFTKSGSLSSQTNCVVTGADEFIGIWYDGDSCCGGLTGASLVTFFDAADDTGGLFDFLLIVADVEVGIGTGFSIRGGMEIGPTALNNLSVGFTFTF